ncbi:cell division protein ZapC [Vibrio ulleungensis]|jgi:cell division protein ZapC|uniref:Cell division protein ZapC n=1 Tax=Vibrio ulleungensis TaxID=2807619 RepID=A0ABS2HDX1_9VIBR|nr:cell division protein ZapC [Vibrio ulleungensis]MBM7035788.1 cell division protein ZapC [Vibrio ulleungensis]
MLKLSDTWNWYYDHSKSALMLDLDDGMLFKANLKTKDLIPCAFQTNQFNVEDAQAFHTFRDSIATLPLNEPRQAELNLNCVAAKRFHKPVQPKSWFFDAGNGVDIPCEGMLVQMQNSLNQGIFIVVEAGDNASICALVDLQDFQLNGYKTLKFGDMVKVMHDRMTHIEYVEVAQPISMVS